MYNKGSVPVADNPCDVKSFHTFGLKIIELFIILKCGHRGVKFMKIKNSSDF